jgi:hypothetical protein
MHQYLQDTEFASQNLFRLATDEGNQLRAITEKLKDKERELQAHQWDFQTSDLNEDFSDAYVMAAFARAGRAAQEVERLKGDVAVLQASVGTRQHAVQALVGAILQIAKQGISLVHGSLSAAPPGKSVGSLAMRDVIWQSRNQSMHYEEGRYKQPLTDMFSTLEREHGSQFSLASFPKQSRAKQVLDLLGWKNYEAYIQDMQGLLPSAT